MQKEVLRKNGEIWGLAWGCLLNGDSPAFVKCWHCYLVTINLRSLTIGRPKNVYWLDVRFGQKLMKDHVNIAILGGD